MHVPRCSLLVRELRKTARYVVKKPDVKRALSIDMPGTLYRRGWVSAAGLFSTDFSWRHSTEETKPRTTNLQLDMDAYHQNVVFWLLRSLCDDVV